jgi:hypothetical protein
VDLLEKGGKSPFFLLGIYWLTVHHVMARFDRVLWLVRSGINGSGSGSGRGRVMTMLMAAMLEMA